MQIADTRCIMLMHVLQIACSKGRWHHRGESHYGETHLLASPQLSIHTFRILDYFEYPFESPSHRLGIGPAFSFRVQWGCFPVEWSHRCAQRT